MEDKGCYESQWLSNYLEASNKSIETDSIEPILEFYANDFNKHYGHIPIEVWESLTPRVVFSD